MREKLTIADLIKEKLFGANKIIKIASENIAASQFIEYQLLKNEQLARFITLYPNPLNEEQPIRKTVEIRRDPEDEVIEEFFLKLIDGDFINKGEVLGAELKEAVVPIWVEHLENTLGYGTNPTLDKVTKGGLNRTIIHFNTTKNGKVRSHVANWALADISKEFTQTIVIPKSLFNTYREFNEILETLLGVTPGRFVYKQDPTTVEADSMDIYIDPEDLVYRGSLVVQLPVAGDKALLIDKYATDPVDPVDPTDPEDGDNTNAIYDFKLSFSEAYTSGEEGHVGYVNPGDSMFLHIKGTEMGKPQMLVLDANHGGDSVVVMDSNEVTVPTNGVVTVPVMYVSSTVNDTLTVLGKIDGAIVGATRTVHLLATKVTPVFTAGQVPPFIPTGIDFGITVESNTHEYTPRSVVWSSVPVGGAIITPNSNDHLAVSVKLADTLVPDNTVVITAMVDGEPVTFETITVVAP